MTRVRWAILTAILAGWLAAPAAEAVRIADITHLQGQRENTLTSVGLVVGLSGTGDGGKFTPTIKSLAALLQNFGNSVQVLDELKKVKSVALVSVTATIGRNGAREGEKLDVTVSAIGSASSLKGGRLFHTPLVGPDPKDLTIYALAEGPISVDAANPTTGVIKDGAVMEQDVRYFLIDNDSFILVIDDVHASWAMASAIEMTINESVSVEQAHVQLAKVLDPKTVRVTIPAAERSAPAAFIAGVQRLPLLMPEKQARVTVDERQGTIIVDGHVTIAPVTISFKGMTISTETVLKEKKGKDAGSDPDVYEWVELRLLVSALDALQVPVQDRIAIIRELARSGNLQGQLVEKR